MIILIVHFSLVYHFQIIATVKTIRKWDRGYVILKTENTDLKLKLNRDRGNRWTGLKATTKDAGKFTAALDRNSDIFSKITKLEVTFLSSNDPK